MESLGTSPKRNDGGDGRPWGVAAQSWATAHATLTEKRAMKKEEKEEEEIFSICLDTLGKNNLVVFACLVLYLCKSSILVKSHWIIIGNLFQFSWQWCRSLLSIGGDNLQFYHNFALFSTLGGWTSTTILLRCGNLVKTKEKNANGTLFLPEFR